MSRPGSALRLAALVGLAGALGACTEYLDRKDTVSSSAGNAVQTNLVTHMIDPWPAHARETRIASDGQRVQAAVQRYREGEVKEPQGQRTTSSSR
jgi:hypothetical protein